MWWECGKFGGSPPAHRPSPTLCPKVLVGIRWRRRRWSRAQHDGDDDLRTMRDTTASMALREQHRERERVYNGFCLPSLPPPARGRHYLKFDIEKSRRCFWQSVVFGLTFTLILKINNGVRRRWTSVKSLKKATQILDFDGGRGEMGLLRSFKSQEISSCFGGKGDVALPISIFTRVILPSLRFRLPRRRRGSQPRRSRGSSSSSSTRTMKTTSEIGFRWCRLRVYIYRVKHT